VRFLDKLCAASSLTGMMIFAGMGVEAMSSEKNIYFLWYALSVFLGLLFISSLADIIQSKHD